MKIAFTLGLYTVVYCIPPNPDLRSPYGKGTHEKSELKKNLEARKKAEREILDIRKELKDVLLVHHATIKDLQKQVRQMHRKIATIDSSRKSTSVKTIAKKTTLKKKSSQKKSRKP